ncbi:MAG TPA: sulfotransferase family 2 domain-containing protein [Steroidobacteraceae bacterium]
MIISSRRKFIFVHIPKTAGSSVSTALRKWDSRFGWKRSNHQHDTLPEFLALNCKKMARVHPDGSRSFLDQYFKFAFVRNPWERFVSFFFYLKNHHGRQIPELGSIVEVMDLLKALERRAPWLVKLHGIRPQSDFLYGADQRLLVDFVGRFERLEEDFRTVAARIGIAGSLPHRNASEHDSYARYYDIWGKEFIADYYKNDISSLGYTFSP